MMKLIISTLLVAGVATTANAQADSCPLTCEHGTVCELGSSDFSAHPKDINDQPFFFHRDVTREGWHCVCPDNFTGLRCARPYVECEGTGHFCYHGGKCIDGLDDMVNPNHLFCDCSDADYGGHPYAGKYCEVEIIECDEEEGSFCANRGECRPGFEDAPHPCSCGEGYRGNHCEFDLGFVPDCDLDCENGGACNLGIKDYDTAVYNAFWATHDGNFQFCECPEGYFGNECQVEGEKCGDSHCFNGAACLQTLDSDGKTTYQCDCRAANDNEKSYGGEYCQAESTTFCTKNPDHNGHLFCVNGGTCLEESHKGCNCTEGFHGPICEYAESEPAPSCRLVCQNGGDCRIGAKDNQLLANYGDNLLQYNASHTIDYEHCVCPDGYFGLECEHQLEICPGGQHVCLHGSKCVPVDETTEEGGHECDCDGASTSEERYAGKFCQYSSTDICTEDGRPGVGKANFAFCVNNGKCKGTVADNEPHPGCTCQEGFKGDHCEFLEEENLPVEEEEEVAEPATNLPESTTNDNSNGGLVIGLGVALLVLVSIIVVALVVKVSTARTKGKSGSVATTKSESPKAMPQEPSGPTGFSADGDVVAEKDLQTVEII